MKHVFRVATLVLSVSTTACVSYSSIHSADGKIYLSGAKSFWFVNIPFLKRCDLVETVLHCEELEEYKPPEDAQQSGGPPGQAAEGEGEVPTTEGAPTPEPSTTEEDSKADAEKETATDDDAAATPETKAKPEKKPEKT